jgi:hypothetical protein
MVRTKRVRTYNVMSQFVPEYRVRVPWYTCTMVLVPGTRVPWNHGTRVPWNHGTIGTTWYTCTYTCTQVVFEIAYTCTMVLEYVHGG